MGQKKPMFKGGRAEEMSLTNEETYLMTGMTYS